jgi:predicted XRE-type DNA-binding protein
MDNQGEIILYQSEDVTQLEVRIENETIWLTQNQIAELFGTKRPAISKHLKNIFLSGELQELTTCSILEHMGADDKRLYKTVYYNLDAILSVGYRVNSKNATQFRIWANSILKEYLMKGYVLNSRIDRIEKKIFEHDQKFDLLIKTTLPPNEGVFYDGQIFDAWKFAADLVKSAQRSIVLIDNYIDESVLHLMAKRKVGVTCTIYTSKISKEMKLDIEKFNAQYDPIVLCEFAKSHDRFLIIDNETVYHIGASLKDLAKKWFAFSKLNWEANELISKLK